MSDSVVHCQAENGIALITLDNRRDLCFVKIGH
jgi:hypothetical protein